jgi:hypothetical protein
MTNPRKGSEMNRKELIEALKQCQQFQPDALDKCRKHKFVFRGKGGRWEKLAFTFYSNLCEINSICRNVLESDRDREGTK